MAKSKIYGWRKILSEGQVVETYYDDEVDLMFMYFSRRLDSEIMGEYRSIEELNKGLGSNFQLSKNKRSLLTLIYLSVEAAFALRGTLGKTIHSSRKEIRKNAMRKANEEMVVRTMAYFSELEK